MSTLSQSTEAHLLEQLAQCFYTVVPEQYKTYCSFTSAIAQTVLQQMGLEPQAISPAEFGSLVRSEITKYASIVKAANVKADQ